MKAFRRRRPLTLLLTVLALVFVQAAPATAADWVIPLDWKVDATTTMKKLNQTVTINNGSFVGTVTIFDANPPKPAALTGTMKLPPASTTMKLGSLPIATTTFEMAAVPGKPVTGTIDLQAKPIKAQTTAESQVRLREMRLSFMPWWNLVGDNCRTATNVKVNMGGDVKDLLGSNTFSGSFTMPKFTGCGLFMDAIINMIVPGPGNTLSATFGPKVAATKP